MSQFALRWILMFDAVSCAIPGGKRAGAGGRQLPGLGRWRRFRPKPWRQLNVFTMKKFARKSTSAGEFRLSRRRRSHSGQIAQAPFFERICC